MSDIMPLSTLSPLEKSLDAITPEASPEVVLGVFTRLKFHQETIDRLVKMAESLMLEYLKAGGKLEISPGVHYYRVKTDKKTTCTDTAKAAEALLEACGGDWEAFCRVLSAQPIKHGAAKTILPEDVYAQYFVTEVKERLEEKLGKADEAFMK